MGGCAHGDFSTTARPEQFSAPTDPAYPAEILKARAERVRAEGGLSRLEPKTPADFHGEYPPWWPRHESRSLGAPRFCRSPQGTEEPFSWLRIVMGHSTGSGMPCQRPPEGASPLIGSPEAPAHPAG